MKSIICLLLALSCIGLGLFLGNHPLSNDTSFLTSLIPFITDIVSLFTLLLIAQQAKAANQQAKAANQQAEATKAMLQLQEDAAYTPICALVNLCYTVDNGICFSIINHSRFHIFVNVVASIEQNGTISKCLDYHGNQDEDPHPGRRFYNGNEDWRISPLTERGGHIEPGSQFESLFRLELSKIVEDKFELVFNLKFRSQYRKEYSGEIQERYLWKPEKNCFSYGS